MNSNALETILRELKKVAEQFLTNEGPLNKIIHACNRFIALMGCARLDKIKQELNDALHSINDYTEALKRLINDANKHLD